MADSGGLATVLMLNAFILLVWGGRGGIQSHSAGYREPEYPCRAFISLVCCILLYMPSLLSTYIQ
jgi:hypothetical protein